ncbi:hypothetical protein [Lentzea flava]|uniref:hypothetical protein n=1 Tax=Lentzea flava TaxID=103732 RepID=UPI00166F9190|nr:hypothetical protein [Lentzea flava]
MAEDPAHSAPIAGFAERASTSVTRALTSGAPGGNFGSPVVQRRTAPALAATPPVTHTPQAALPVADPTPIVVARTPDPEPAAQSQEAPAVQRSEAPPQAQQGASQNADELLRKLYDPLLRRLKADLWLDRERRGALTDL